jgi:hypothetical protein
MKIKSEDILKPGAILKVEVIDWSDPEIKKLYEDCRKEQERIKRLMPQNWTQKQWDMLNNIITI